MAKRLVEQAKPGDIKGMCRAINRLAGGKAEQRMSELDSIVTSAVNSIIDSAVTSVVSHFDSAITSAVSDAISGLSNATSAVQSGLDSAVSDLGSKIIVVSGQASATSNAVSAISNLAETNSDTLSLVSNQASANSVAINSVESTLSSVITSTAASLVGHFDSAITSTASVLSGATSIVRSGVDSVETIASDAYSLASDTRSLADANEALLDSFNGIFIETIDFTVSESGGTVTGSLERDGTGDLTQRFSDGYSTLDCTPALTIDLTAYVGTDAVPKEVFVYILQSAKTVVAASNSDWPATEHIKIANLVLKSAATTGTDGGALVNRNWNDHAQSSDSQGHITHIEQRIRQEPTQWDSGVALTLKDAAGAGLPTGNSSTAIEMVLTTGKVYQLHRQTFPAFDMYTTATDDAHVVNQPTDEGGAYETIVDLVTDITHYVDGTAAGVAISVNKYFNLVVWGVQNRSGEVSHVMINLPTGQYSTEAAAISDTSGTSVFDIPSAFKGVGFLIARLTFRLIAGSQWTYIAQEDLRGQAPSTSAGVGVTTTDHALLTGLSNDDHTQYALDSALVSTTKVLSDTISLAESGVTSVNTRMLSVTSDMTASINAMVDSAISDVVATNTSDNASIVAHFDSAILSTDTVLKSDIASLATMVDSAISDVVATNASGNASLATMVDSAISDVVATNTSDNLSLVGHFDSAITSIAVVLSDATSVVRSAVDSLETIASDALSLASNLDSIHGAAVNSTITLLQASSTATKQAQIDAVHRYIPEGIEVVFQFETGKTHTETAALDFIGFWGGGRVKIQGNTAEAGATTLHTTQDTILDFTTNAVDGINIRSCTVGDLQVKNLKITIQDVAALAAVRAQYDQGAMFIRYNYLLSSGVTNAAAGFRSFNSSGTITVQRNYVSNVYYGIQATTGKLISNENDDTGTQPVYGLYAHNAGTIGKTSTQPAGSTADELIESGAAIRPFIDLTLLGVLWLTERAADKTNVAGLGQLWVKNTTPCELWFSDDAGTSTQIV